MKAGAQLRVVAVHLHRLHPPAGLQGSVERLRGVLEDGHETVAQALHDAPVALGQGRVHGGPDLSQEVKRRVVPRLERPVGEPHEVHEQDRQRLVAAEAAPQRLGGLHRPGLFVECPQRGASARDVALHQRVFITSSWRPPEGARTRTSRPRFVSRLR